MDKTLEVYVNGGYSYKATHTCPSFLGLISSGEEKRQARADWHLRIPGLCPNHVGLVNIRIDSSNFLEYGMPHMKKIICS